MGIGYSYEPSPFPEALKKSILETNEIKWSGHDPETPLTSRFSTMRDVLIKDIPTCYVNIRTPLITRGTYRKNIPEYSRKWYFLNRSKLLNVTRQEYNEWNDQKQMTTIPNAPDLCNKCEYSEISEIERVVPKIYF